MAENLQQALARLETTNAQLEQEVEKERILLTERKELVDSLSHEMKTPLGIMRAAYAEGLQDETDETKQQKYAQVIAQTLDNLIVHAKKNVSPDGILRLEVTAGSGVLHFSSFNQGKTITEHDLSKIWTKFYRDSSAEYSGSELGLSIVAQILSMQNLPYSAENQADGVRFWYAIPVTE